MLLKNSLANQEAVQAKRQQKKSSRASGQEEKKNCSECECSFYSSSEQIPINFQALGCI